MAKYLKSFFTTEKRIEDDLEDIEPPPIDVRRKLSMSRSGRLKQSYKKRQQLSVEIYDGEDLRETERPKTLEYHVNKSVTPTSTITAKQVKQHDIELIQSSRTAEKCDDRLSDEEIQSRVKIPG